MSPDIHATLKRRNPHEALNARDTECSSGIKYT